MFGLQHIKFDSMTYVMHYKNGEVFGRVVDYPSFISLQTAQLLQFQWEVMIYRLFLMKPQAIINK